MSAEASGGGTNAFSVIRKLTIARLPLHDEKELQRSIAVILPLPLFEPEYELDERNIIDFFGGGIGIEVKINGSKRSIFNQCNRYCQFPVIKEFILVTNKSMGLPETINGKPCYVVNLGKAWL